MERRTRWIAVACVSLLAAAAAAQRSSPEQLRAIAGDPPMRTQRLTLQDVPRATGPAVSLFNGRDLRDWTGWLGYADPALTYKRPPQAPLGRGGDHAGAFDVVREDGAPAIHILGRTWGSLVHRTDFANYHLRLEYKWGPRTWAPREREPQNNGLLYHSHGSPGAVWGTWMTAVEFEIMKGSVGMVVPVGDDVRVTTSVGHDPAIIYPHRRYLAGGRRIEVVAPAWNVEAARDAERAVGRWNTLDLYVLGDRAVHVVNGVPVLAVDRLSELDPETGARRPLTRGRIQLQSEGAETFFRAITVEPITALPRIVVDGAGA